MVPVWFGDLSGALSKFKHKGAKSLTILVCWTIWWELVTKGFLKKKERDWALLVSEV
jgi:hypothetical protein